MQFLSDAISESILKHLIKLLTVPELETPGHCLSIPV